MITRVGVDHGRGGRLTFDDIQSDFNTTADGCSPGHSTPHDLVSPGETVVEVQARELEMEEL